MKSSLMRTAVIALAVGLAGCTTPGGGGAGPVDVTRFHLNQPFARSTIAIEPVDAADRNMFGYNAQHAAVARQLARLGWTVVASGMGSEQIALIDIEQGSRAALAARGSGISVGLGGSSGGWGRSGVGVGLGVGFPLGGNRSRELVSTRLEVSIRRRSDGSVFWEGRAETEGRAGTPHADPAFVVEKLAQALFLDFPGESGRTIRLP